MLRNIGFGLGVGGAELHERMQMTHEEMADVLNTLLEIGYVEAASMKERVTAESYRTETFEVNPAFVADLKAVMRR